MQGNPVIRVLVLIVSLAVMGGVIASVVGRPPSAPIDKSPSVPDSEIPASLTIQLSGPARSLRLTSLDGTRSLLDQTTPDLEDEHAITFPLRNRGFTALLSVEWTDPTQPNFLRLILEPESLVSREVILHAPDNLQEHAVEFLWPED